MPRSTVKLNLNPLRRFARSISDGGPHIAAAQRQWGARYLGFARRRFARMSRGGADHRGRRWQPLAASTIKRRRKGGKRRGGVNKVAVNRTRTGGNVAILRDTNTMFAGLEPGNQSNLFQDIPRGVRVGLTGPGGRIASYHQRGSRRLPQRRIIVEPDQQTLKLMAGDMTRAIKRQIKDASRALGRRPRTP